MAIHHPLVDTGAGVDRVHHGREAPRRLSGEPPGSGAEPEQRARFGPDPVVNPALRVEPSRLAIWETDGGRVCSSTAADRRDAVAGGALLALVAESAVGPQAAAQSIDASAGDWTTGSDGSRPSGWEPGAGNAQALDLVEVRTALAGAKGDLLRAHHGILDDARNDVEGLAGAACSPYIKDLARLAMGADAEGLSAEGWRAWVVEGLGPEAGSLVDSAETCMRASGLWPWRG